MEWTADSRPKPTVRVYVDTSVVIALAHTEDEFHRNSVRCIGYIRDRGLPCLIGEPFLLELGRAVELRGRVPSFQLTEAMEEYEVELMNVDDERLWELLDEYSSRGVLGQKQTVDLMHYASATLLECTHLAAWDRKHFNARVGRRVNRVNSSKGLADLIVGDPIVIVRSIGLV